jgi:catechol 2,3-dioxygenase-like lactoylglutathione lyase family enzyme
MSHQIRFAGNGQLSITAPDLAQARDFFSGVLGLPLDFESDEALGAGATIVHDRGKGGFTFADPFGLIYDVVSED